MNTLIKKDSGITSVALIIIVVLMIIVISICIYEGKKIISGNKVRTLETNMLNINAKAKAYAEEIEAKIWSKKDKSVERDKEFEKKKMIVTTVNEEMLKYVDSKIKEDNEYVAYEVTKEALSNMGLEEPKTGRYIVIFSTKDYKLMDTIYSEGIVYNREDPYFALSDLKEALENE